MTFNHYLDDVAAEKPPFLITPFTITVILEGTPYVVASSHPNHALLLEAIKEERWEDVDKLASVEDAVAEYIKEGNVTIENGVVYYVGGDGDIKEACEGYVVDRILQFMNEGLDPKPLMNFLGKVMQNGSFRVIRDLFTFLENRNMPLDQDGDFYGYKAIKNNWMDKHSGTISNHIGASLVFDRRKVDDDPQHDCSYGLHVGSIQYVKGFTYSYGKEGGDRIVIVKVNPADVVAVPEYDTTKLRCCRYDVVSEFTGLLPDTTWEVGDRVVPEGQGRHEQPAEKASDDEWECDDEVCEDCGEDYAYCDC